MAVNVREILLDVWDESNNLFRTNATISGDVNVDNNSVDTNGLIGKSGGADFTTAYASATTITIGAMPFTHTFIADDIISVQQISTAGAVVNTYTRDDKTMAVAGGTTLTVTGATFGATDTFVIYTNIATAPLKDTANTARTTGTLLTPIQSIDATGSVAPAGDAVGNAPFNKLTDGTNTATVDAANTARTTGTIIQATQHIGANGGVLPSGATAGDPIHVSTGGVVASTMGQGRRYVTTPGTAVTLAGSTAIKEVTITAETNNTDVITVGGSGVIGAEATRQGTPLYPGDSVTVKSDNLNEIYLDSIVATEGVTYSYLA